MKNREKDLVRFEHILEAIRLIEKFTENKNIHQFSNDLLLQSALIRQFEIIGEASANISSDLKKSYPDVEWNTIKDFRNLLIHEYFRIDKAEVWATVKNDVPLLKSQINSIVKTLE